jgi:hypothetical protein
MRVMETYHDLRESASFMQHVCKQPADAGRTGVGRIVIRCQHVALPKISARVSAPQWGTGLHVCWFEDHGMIIRRKVGVMKNRIVLRLVLFPTVRSDFSPGQLSPGKDRNLFSSFGMMCPWFLFGMLEMVNWMLSDPQGDSTGLWKGEFNTSRSVMRRRTTSFLPEKEFNEYPSRLPRISG